VKWVDAAVAAATLAGLPALSPRRLRLLLQHHEPADALGRLVDGRHLHTMFTRRVGDDLAEIRRQARAADVDGVVAACEGHGIEVVVPGDGRYPAALVHDPDPPAVLFVRGDLGTINARRVGVIGTRNATASGLATAADLGRQLADEGVTVVSGLARGIDGACHRGVRDSDGPGRAVGVVANGLDRPYPARHTQLWEWVATHGLLLSEWPPGVGPVAWRFPMRNRILAALCEVLVVVESRERGGSLITVRAAADRGVDVMAVPGSPRCRASAGTNRLLVDGAAPVTSVHDVLDVLGLDHRRQSELPFDPRPLPVGLQADVLAACRTEPSTLDMLVAALGVGVAEVAMAVARLERSGWLCEAGGWFEPSGSRLGTP
jgi:DNA processing protein